VGKRCQVTCVLSFFATPPFGNVCLVKSAPDEACNPIDKLDDATSRTSESGSGSYAGGRMPRASFPHART
jgi:hypothetical protein